MQMRRALTRRVAQSLTNSRRGRCKRWRRLSGSLCRRFEKPVRELSRIPQVPQARVEGGRCLLATVSLRANQVLNCFPSGRTAVGHRIPVLRELVPPNETRFIAAAFDDAGFGERRRLFLGSRELVRFPER